MRRGEVELSKVKSSEADFGAEQKDSQLLVSDRLTGTPLWTTVSGRR